MKKIHLPLKTLPKPAQIPHTARALPQSLQQECGNEIRCLACARGCTLHESQIGFCSAVTRWGNSLYNTAYGVAGELAIKKIEEKAFHFKPNSSVLSIGQLGCSLRCSFCQNFDLAYSNASQGGNLDEPNAPPEQIIAAALEYGCDGISWSHNEPTISPQYVYDCAALAHQHGLYTVLVTNGLITYEAMDFLGPVIDVYRVDIKSLDASFYKTVAGMPSNKTLLPVTAYGWQKYGFHLETSTNLMPGLNDSEDHLERLTCAIKDYLGKDTPWHCTTYIPYAFMAHIPATPSETLQKARNIGIKNGLSYVYTDDLAFPETHNTFCPNCHALLISRNLDEVKLYSFNTNKNCCSYCNFKINIVI